MALCRCRVTERMRYRSPRPPRSEAGVNPALSRNCDAFPHPLTAIGGPEPGMRRLSQVACGAVAESAFEEGRPVGGA
ncbi:hypothetical protein GCM10022225_52820 [Plantactinospora mayteni]|uniref:Uncharacterized protein n=1 Tax=Plantactinospora mayteni TaxID=566021 RepID=A0ABQ4EYT9_9ACTN|nr:hypothetical protein Pma05_63740 [Plantactinospora mayteni]